MLTQIRNISEAISTQMLNILTQVRNPAKDYFKRAKKDKEQFTAAFRALLEYAETFRLLFAKNPNFQKNNRQSVLRELAE